MSIPNVCSNVNARGGATSDSSNEGRMARDQSVIDSDSFKPRAQTTGSPLSVMAAPLPITAQIRLSDDEPAAVIAIGSSPPPIGTYYRTVIAKASGKPTIKCAGKTVRPEQVITGFAPSPAASLASRSAPPSGSTLRNHIASTADSLCENPCCERKPTEVCQLQLEGAAVRVRATFGSLGVGDGSSGRLSLSEGMCPRPGNCDIGSLVCKPFGSSRMVHAVV